MRLAPKHINSGHRTVVFEVSRLFFAFLFLSISGTAGAQPDSLLQLTSNERYPILENLIRPAFQKADSAKLFAQLETLRIFAQNYGDKAFQLEVESMTLKARIEFSSKTNIDEIEVPLINLLEAAKKSNNQILRATFEYDLADYYWERKSAYYQAMLHYENAYQLSIKLRDEDYYLKERNIYKIGEKYYFLTDYSSAILYLLEAEKVNNPRDSLQPKISTFNTLGLAYRLEGQLDKAAESFLKGIEYAKKADALAWIGNLSGNLGYVYILQGDIEKGEHLLNIDKNISLEKGAKSSAAGALLQLAQLNADNGKISLAEQQLDSALLLMNHKILYPRRKIYYRVMSKISGYKGDWASATAYLDSAIIVMDSLAKKDNALQLLRMKQRLELEQSKVEISKSDARDRKRSIQIYFMIAGLLLAIGAGGMILRQKRKTDKARKRSDELLLNILPADVAEELKLTGASKARRFPEVTVLFSDFKNFTTHSEQMPPGELVKILNDYFKGFDQIVTAFGLEKIKTIGDAYICVGGLPASDPKHAENTVRAALEIQEFTKKSLAGWELRIGIHSGPVVAGIVGVTKFAYDIWGDAVNIAARLEQNAVPGKINISKDTYDLICNEFECTYRGKLEAKNKGALDMYFVEWEKI